MYNYILYWQKMTSLKRLGVIIVAEDKKYINYTENIVYNEVFNKLNIPLNFFYCVK